MTQITVIIVSYLIGSFPVSYLIARYWKGIDIRQHGSGNVGMTNVWRNVGPLAGLLALAGDMAKGALAVWLGGVYGGPWLVAMAGAAVLAGHSWPIFLGFKGGKLIATSAGILLALSYPLLLLAGAVWFIVVGISRYISLGSIIAVVSVPVFMYSLKLPGPYLALGALMASLALYRHIPNIKRLASGIEPKIGQKKDQRG